MRLHTKHVLCLSTLIYLVLMISGGLYVRMAFQVPHDAATAVAFVAQHHREIGLGSFLECLSAVSLALFMACSIADLKPAGTRSAGRDIASIGAAGTPLMLVGSALATWSLTDVGIASTSGAVQTLQAIAFDTGGPGFAVFLGLFVGGGTVAFSKRAPGWLTALGALVACAGLLSSLRLLSFAGGYIIPAARFLSILWMLAVTLELPLSGNGYEEASLDSR